jgi:hexosaminidase
MKFLILLCLISIINSSIGANKLNDFVVPSIWPQPSTFTTGDKRVRIADSSTLNFNIEPKGSDIKTLSEAFLRYEKLIFSHAAVSTNNDKYPTISTIIVNVDSISEDYPQMDTDESYSLDIPSENDQPIKIHAKTVYGALRALESFSQLVIFDYTNENYIITSTPISIQDSPRYNHRGLMLDSARHYQPVSVIKRTIDALSYAKFNVLHWHVVDTQSFPFQSVTYPNLWDGAFSKQEKYTQTEMKNIVEFGRLRGVKVMIEFDVPGHAASWCAGYPEICPSITCLQPLDPSNDLTFTLIDSLLGECTGNHQGQGLFPYDLIHLGGDEVSYTCWETTPHVVEWEKQNDIDGSEGAYEYFVDKVATIARTQQRTPVQWVEVFEHFGSNLDNNTIVHIWKDKETLDSVVVAGYRTLLSDSDVWYLDHLQVTWDEMYANEPTEGLSIDADANLILGGETCMWGETVDASDIDNTIWPRAAAVSERLWTSLSQINIDTAEDRLETFRCLLTQRGIAAAAVTNRIARYEPKGPGSCYAQRRLTSN